jgi:hypothetical protein
MWLVAAKPTMFASLAHIAAAEVTRGLGNSLRVDNESLDVVQSSGDGVVGRHCGHGRASPCRSWFEHFALQTDR